MNIRTGLLGLLMIAFAGTAQAGSEPPPAPPASICPQASARIDVTTSPDVGGINAGTTDVMDNAALDAMAALGPGWVRTTVRWADIQSDGPDAYDWSIPDTNIRNFKARGLKVLAVIVGTPKWAFATTLGNCNRSGTPTLREGAAGGTEAGCVDYQICLVNPACTGGPQIPAEKFWRPFISAVVNRYNGQTRDPQSASLTLPRVDAWEIWNEPNGGKDKFNGSLVQYHDLVLAPAVDQIRRRSNNLGAFIVAPALATNQYADADRSVQDSMVATALRDALVGTATQPVSIDAVSLHSYKAAQQTMSTGASFRSALNAQFDWQYVPLWLTEYGKNSATGCTGTDTSCGEADQYCAYRDFQYRNWGGATPPVFAKAFWYMFSDSLTPQRTVSHGYGVLGKCTICAEPCNYVYYSKQLYGEMQRNHGKSPLSTRTPFGAP
ncbi:MAG TPA: cellulase family glycosylhydrolase [Solimonas sp.]|nr:cellulase family glycosylhydrolase [Solimonas sp.]